MQAAAATLNEKARRKPARRPLPAHLPRETETITPKQEACPGCGGKLRLLGDDVCETLEYIPARFKVMRTVRPKLSCACCARVVQEPAPNRVIDRGLAGPGLLAHVLVAKYADHLPLYRQSEIYEREGVELDRSTLADWVGGASRTLTPLVDALKRYVLSAEKLHGDDVPVPVLAPGTGKTKTGRLWTYVRDCQTFLAVIVVNEETERRRLLVACQTKSVQPCTDPAKAPMTLRDLTHEFCAGR